MEALSEKEQPVKRSDTYHSLVMSCPDLIWPGFVPRCGQTQCRGHGAGTDTGKPICLKDTQLKSLPLEGGNVRALEFPNFSFTSKI